MNIKKLLTWLPQVLSISLTLLLFTFLFQFTPGGFEWPHFMYALIPGIIALLFAVLAWFLPKPGGIVYVLAGVAYIILMWGKVTVIAIGILSGVSIITGVLYFLQKQKEKVVIKEKPASEQVPTAEKEPEEKIDKLQETVVSLPKKSSVPVEEQLEVQPKELPPLPQRVDKPKAITEILVDDKESDLFGNIPAATEKEEVKVESKLLEPQPPKGEVEELPSLQKDLGLPDAPKVVPELTEKPAPVEGTVGDIETQLKSTITPTPDTEVLEKDSTIKTELPPLPIKTELPPLPIKTEAESLVVGTSEPEEKIEDMVASLSSTVSEKKPPEVPAPVSELSVLEYPEEITGTPPTADGLTTKPVVESIEDLSSPLPTETEKETPASWKSAKPDTDETILDMTPDLPQVSLTSKGTSQSGDQLAKDGSAVTTTSDPGVNPDFMQWAKKEE